MRRLAVCSFFLAALVLAGCGGDSTTIPPSTIHTRVGHRHVRDCGHIRLGGPRGSAGPIRPTNVGCTTARRLVHKAARASGCDGTSSCHVAGFACKPDYAGGGIISVRCTMGTREVRWYWGGCQASMT